MNVITYNDVFRVLYENHDYYLVESFLDINPINNIISTTLNTFPPIIIIQRAWRRYKHRKIYKFIKEKLYKLSMQDPQRVLRSIDCLEASCMDKGSGQVLVFRLAGEKFPPCIVYKIFTNMVNVRFYYRHLKSNDVACSRNWSGWKVKRDFPKGWRIFYEYKNERNRKKIIRTATVPYQRKRKRVKSVPVITWINERYGRCQS